MVVSNRRRLLLPEMEGRMARWYDRQRSTTNQQKAYREQAAELTKSLPDGSAVLEVAPGPGYLAIEIARRGGFRVAALDISHTFVEIATENAARANVSVDFRQGDASAMPFQPETFDLVICQAAFKNFRQPLTALNEIHRVLRPGGRAIIQDMRKAATRSDIAREVEQQGLAGINGWVTRQILAALRRRAYSRSRFESLVGASAFGKGAIYEDGIGLEVRLKRES